MRRLPAVCLVLLAAGCGKTSKDDSSVNACIQSLGDSNPEVRYTAASTLRQYGPEAAPAVPALTKALTDPDKNVRVGVAYALAEIGPAARTAVPGLREAAKDRDKDVRDAANYALKRLADK